MRKSRDQSHGKRFKDSSTRPPFEKNELAHPFTKTAVILLVTHRQTCSWKVGEFGIVGNFLSKLET